MEKTKNTQRKLLNTKTMITLAMLATVAFVVTAVIRFIVPFPQAPFLQMDFKDIIIVIGGFIFGPLSAFIITLIVAFVEMVTVGSSGPIGFFMNVVSGTAFACTAAFVYSKKRTMFGAMFGLLLGVVAMTVIMVLWNIILTPIFMNMDRAWIVENLILQVFVPFNIFKGVVNSALILLMYKPVVSALRAARLMPAPKIEDAAEKGKAKPAPVLAALFLLGTSILWYMALNEVGFFRPDPAPMVVVNGEGVQNANHRNFPTHVSLQPVISALGLEPHIVNEDTGAIEITGSRGNVSFIIGSDVFYLNGQAVILGSPAMQVGSMIYVPVSFFAEIFGIDNVYYDQGQILIYNNSEEAGDND